MGWMARSQRCMARTQEAGPASGSLTPWQISGAWDCRPSTPGVIELGPRVSRPSIEQPNHETTVEGVKVGCRPRRRLYLAAYRFDQTARISTTCGVSTFSTVP